MRLPFLQLDVFATTPYSGNPLAVVLGAEGLDTGRMRVISSWTNLSECTFVLPPTEPGVDHRVRIFSGRTELPFAGHPTLGTAAAWVHSGGVPRVDGTIVQQCGIGPVEVAHSGDHFAFAAPATLREGPASSEDLAHAAEVLGTSPSAVEEARWVDNGPGWLGILLPDPDPEAVAALRPAAVPGQACSIGVIAPTGPGDADAFVVRTFFSETDGPLVEDPVTGSFNASAAQWMIASGRARPPYTVRHADNSAGRGVCSSRSRRARCGSGAPHGSASRGRSRSEPVPPQSRQPLPPLTRPSVLPRAASPQARPSSAASQGRPDRLLQG